MGAPSPEKGPIGAKISIIIVVLVLAFGAYYFLRQVPVDEGMGDTLLTPAEVQGDSAISNLSAQGTSTDLGDIQKDLDATDLSGLDAGLGDITI